MNKDKALKLALEALEENEVNGSDYDFAPAYEGAKQRRQEAITAIKEALEQPKQDEKFCDANCVWTDHHPDCKLAQPAQELVAWMRSDGMKAMPALEKEALLSTGLDFYREIAEEYSAHLYTTPPKREWVGLTEDEREEIENRPFSQSDWLWLYTQAIEAKLKEKNT